MSAPENIKSLLATEVQAVKQSQGMSGAKNVVDARKALLTRVQQTAASGNAEATIELERDFLENDLDHYAKAPDKEMIGSLKAGLEGITAIEQQLEIVDDPGKYKAIDRAHTMRRNRKQGLPVDEARQAFGSHRARLGNYVKARLEDTEKQVIQARRKALGIAEKDYIRRQMKTLDVELPESAKPAQTKGDKGAPSDGEEARRTKIGKVALSAEQEAKKKALETAYKSLPKEEALKAHPELAGVYKNKDFLTEKRDSLIEDRDQLIKNHDEFTKGVENRSFEELAKGSSLPDLAKQQQQTPQPSVKDLDIAR